jgi:hypothetical protein
MQSGPADDARECLPGLVNALDPKRLCDRYVTVSSLQPCLLHRKLATLSGLSSRAKPRDLLSCSAFLVHHPGVTRGSHFQAAAAFTATRSRGIHCSNEEVSAVPRRDCITYCRRTQHWVRPPRRPTHAGLFSSVPSGLILFARICKRSTAVLGYYHPSAEGGLSQQASLLGTPFAERHGTPYDGRKHYRSAALSHQRTFQLLPEREPRADQQHLARQRRGPVHAVLARLYECPERRDRLEILKQTTVSYDEFITRFKGNTHWQLTGLHYRSGTVRLAAWELMFHPSGPLHALRHSMRMEPSTRLATAFCHIPDTHRTVWQTAQRI